MATTYGATPHSQYTNLWSPFILVDGKQAYTPRLRCRKTHRGAIALARRIAVVWDPKATEQQ